MKKLTLVFGIMVALSSCKKSYNCVCMTTNSQGLYVVQVSSNTTKAAHQSDAYSECQAESHGSIGCNIK